MKTHSHIGIAASFLHLLLFGGATGLRAQTDSAGRIAAGALLNLDAGGIPPRELSRSQVPLELSDAELSLLLHVRPDLDLQAVFVHEDGVAMVDQAFATWRAPAADIAFGKLVLPLGLYPGRLIHDPLLQQDVETILPAVKVTRELCPIVLHLSAARFSHLADTVELVAPGSVAALDWAWCEDGLVRLSTKLAHHARALDFAARIPIGAVHVDLEGLAQEGAWTESDWAALLGLSWKPHEALHVAVRLDARRAKGEDDLSRAAAAAATLRFAQYAYAAAEWSQDLDGEGALTLRLGLEI